MDPAADLARWAWRVAPLCQQLSQRPCAASRTQRQTTGALSWPSHRQLHWGADLRPSAPGLRRRGIPLRGPLPYGHVPFDCMSPSPHNALEPPWRGYCPLSSFYSKGLALSQIGMRTFAYKPIPISHHCHFGLHMAVSGRKLCSI